MQMLRDSMIKIDYGFTRDSTIIIFVLLREIVTIVNICALQSFEITLNLCHDIQDNKKLILIG